MNRKLLANVFYIFALVASCSGGLFIVVIGWNTLSAGKGIGTYSLLLFIEYAVITFFFWLIGFILQKNWKWTTLYFSSIALIGSIFMFADVKFFPG